MSEFAARASVHAYARSLDDPVRSARVADHEMRSPNRRSLWPPQASRPSAQARIMPMSGFLKGIVHSWRLRGQRLLLHAMGTPDSFMADYLTRNKGSKECFGIF